MRKTRRFATMLLMMTVALGGCGSSGISQEEYDRVVTERDELKNTLGENEEKKETEATSYGKETEEIAQDIKLLKSGWSCEKPFDYCSVYYSVEIENPNQGYAVEFPSILITAKDADGKILSTDERVLCAIAAGDTITYGSIMSYEGEAPESVEISVSSNVDNMKKQDDEKYVKQSEFSISNVSENRGDFKNYTGEITNNSQADFGTVSISVIYKLNGEMVGGENGFVDNLKSGQTKAFEISTFSKFEEYDSYEIYANQW